MSEWYEETRERGARKRRDGGWREGTVGRNGGYGERGGWGGGGCLLLHLVQSVYKLDRPHELQHPDQPQHAHEVR